LVRDIMAAISCSLVAGAEGTAEVADFFVLDIFV